MKAAIYGAGSIGTVLGALISKKGVDIELVDNDPKQVEALQKNGAILKGTIELNTPVKAIFPEQMTPGYDVIILAINSNGNSEVLPKLEPLLKKEGVLLTVQNGLPEMEILKVIGSDRTMGATIDWNCELVEPGVVVIHTDQDFLWTHIGKMPGVSSIQAMNARNLLENACRLHYEVNFMGARWCKLIVNCSFSVVSVIYGGTFGETVSKCACRNLIAQCAREVLQVGRANGITLPKLEGINYYSFADYRTFIKKWYFMLSMKHLIRHNKNIRTTQLQNLEKGKKMELDALCGNVIKVGKEHGIPTPVNEKLLEVASAIEQKKEKQGLETIKKILREL